MDAAKIISIGAIYNGLEFCVQAKGVKTNNSYPINDVLVKVEVPDGVAFSRASIPFGEFDTVTSIWTIPTLYPGQELVGEFCYTVTDHCNSSFKFNFSIDSLQACVGCFDGSKYCVIAQGFSCCDLAKCGFTVVSLDEIDDDCPSSPTEPVDSPDVLTDETLHIEVYPGCVLFWTYDYDNSVWNSPIIYSKDVGVFPIRTETSDYEIDAITDYTVLASNGCNTVTLPDAALVEGQVFVIKEIDPALACTVDTLGGDIDGSATFDFTYYNESITVQSDGTNWNIIANYPGTVLITPAPTPAPATPAPTPAPATPAPTPSPA